MPHGYDPNKKLETSLLTVKLGGLTNNSKEEENVI